MYNTAILPEGVLAGPTGSVRQDADGGWSVLFDGHVIPLGYSHEGAVELLADLESGKDSPLNYRVEEPAAFVV